MIIYDLNKTRNKFPPRRKPTDILHFIRKQTHTISQRTRQTKILINNEINKILITFNFVIIKTHDLTV